MKKIYIGLVVLIAGLGASGFKNHEVTEILNRANTNINQDVTSTGSPIFASTQIGTTNASVTLSYTNGLALDDNLSVNGNVTVAGTLVDIDSDVLYAISAKSSQIRMNANEPLAQTLLIQADNSGAGSATLRLASGGQVSVDAATGINFFNYGDDAFYRQIGFYSENTGAGSGNIIFDAYDDIEFSNDGDVRVTIDASSGDVELLTGNLTLADGDITSTGTITADTAYEFFDGSTQAQAATPDGFRWHVGSAALTQSFSVTDQDTNPFGLSFNNSGLKMFALGRTTETVYEYDLNTPWDISTSVYNTNSFVFTADDDDPSGMSFQRNGLKLFVAGNQTDSVLEYDLGTAYDVNTLVYNQSFSVASEETTPRDMTFSETGHEMYVVGTGSATVYQYGLSRPFDISTAVLNQSFSLSSIDTAPHGIISKSCGTIFYISGNTGDSIYELHLTTPLDISTAFLYQQLALDTIDTNPTELFINPDGSKLYFTGAANDSVYELGLGVQMGGSAEIGGGLTVDAGTLFVDDAAKRVVIGASSIPIRGDAKLYITGEDDSFNEGPNFQILTDADAYPILEANARKHDDVTVYLDGYRDGNNHQSSDAGSNYGFRKFDDELYIFQNSGIAPGSTMTLNKALTLDTSGVWTLGSHLYFADSKIARFGAGGDLQIAHVDGLHNLIQSSTVDLVIDNIKNDAQSIMRLGSDDTNTAFEVQNNNEETLFKVDGAGNGTLNGEYLRSNPDNVYDITDPAQLLALATGTTITLTADTLFRINYAGTFVSPVNVVSDGHYFVFQLASTATYVYSNTDTLFTVSQTGFKVGGDIVAAVPGTQFFDVQGTDPASQYVSIDTANIVGFAPGSMDKVTPLFRDALFTDWTDTFELTGVAGGLIDGSGSFKTTTNSTEKSLFSISTFDYAPGQGISISIPNSGGFVNAGESLFRIDPGIHADSRLSISGTTLSGDLFDTSGTNGTFTAVADATITAESITSVSTVTGFARFNYDGSPTVYTDQKVTIDGFAIYTYYNGTWVVTSTGFGWFEIGVLPFGGSEGGGSFDSDSITLTDTGTILSDGDTITLDTDLFTDYDVGAVVYNQLANSVQVNAEYTSTHTGSWSTRGLDQTDPRVLSVNSPSQVESKYFFLGYVNDNSTAVGPITNNSFRPMEFGTMIEAATTERFKLIDTSTGAFEYTGNEEITISLADGPSTVSSGGAQEFRFLWFVDKNTGSYVAIDDPNESMNELGSTAASTPGFSSVTIQKGYRLRRELTRTAGASDLVVRYSTITGSK